MLTFLYQYCYFCNNIKLKFVKIATVCKFDNCSINLASQKLGTLQFPSHNESGFQVQKLIVENLKTGTFFSLSLLELFSTEPPI